METPDTLQTDVEAEELPGVIVASDKRPAHHCERSDSKVQTVI
jgi:hypothetical protein